ncbi:MAG TPA: DUF2892 domain-containing protein [Xanthobacteraceae bacterium]|nr:DUF2892 domain-containing protein [Xanthobacteraceae bacterium]
MSTNVGTVDRAIRIVIGLLLIAYAIPIGFPHTGWNWVGWIGVVPFLTAIVGNCPLYSVLGISSRTTRSLQN